MHNWRAVANLTNGQEALIVLGTSQLHVSTIYTEAYAEVLAPEAQDECIGITLQRWRGRYGSGKWVNVGTLEVPS